MQRSAALILSLVLMTAMTHAQYTRKTLIAHRGASAYAPEHTLASYRLAMSMGADFVEQDLAVTKDGVLICLHDPTLERTTNVKQVFPDRSSEMTVMGGKRKVWLANDFTLAEIKQLDAGSWFDPKFKDEKIVTFQEAIDLVRSKPGTGIFPELKDPEIYDARHIKFEEIVAAALDKNNLRGPKADSKTPVILQTFGEQTARNLAQMKIGVPIVLLVGDAKALDSADKVKAWKGIVQGFGPAKQIVFKNPELVKWTHAEGMSMTVYTVTTREKQTGFPDVTAEMDHYLNKLGVDAVFTDNPDKFPRK